MRLDDRVTIATPEGLTIDLVLAGLGSRFIARLLDSLIQAVIIFALWIGVLGTHAPGSVRAVAIVISFLVTFAYDVRDFQLSGGPGWMGSDHYDIVARPDRSAAPEDGPVDPRKMSDGEMKTMAEKIRALQAKFGKP